MKAPEQGRAKGCPSVHDLRTTGKAERAGDWGRKDHVSRRRDAAAGSSQLEVTHYRQIRGVSAST